MPITISNLKIFPLKSGAAIELKSMNLTNHGPEGDREWVLVQGDEGKHPNKFISQRDKGSERLATVNYRRSQNSHSFFSRLDYAEMEFSIPDSSIDIENMHPVIIHGNKCIGHDAGDTAAFMFSDFLGMPVRLMRTPPSMQRQADVNYAQNGDFVNYADGHQILITSHTSFRALGAFNDQTVNLGRFRGNIEIEGAEAFEEDVMYHVRIGDAELEIIKPCSRCPIPNIDQDSGERHDKEVTNKLNEYRRGGNSDLPGVFFGQNASIRKPGIISTGMELKVLSRKPMHVTLSEGAKLITSITPEM